MSTNPNQVLYDYIAHQVNREDSLVNNRMGWVLQLNGFLFAALALAGKDMPLHLSMFFQLAIPIVGLITSIAGFIGVRAAHRQLDYLKSLWSIQAFPDWPRPFGDPKAFRLGSYAAFWPAATLCICWSTFFVYQLWTINA
jgi:hypothetical protein